MEIVKQDNNNVKITDTSEVVVSLDLLIKRRTALLEQKARYDSEIKKLDTIINQASELGIKTQAEIKEAVFPAPAK